MARPKGKRKGDVTVSCQKNVHTFSCRGPPDLNAAVRAPTCLETRSRVFFDSDEPEQRHRVLIEFGLCAGVALATDHRPVEGVPVYFFLVGTSANFHWGV